MKPCTAQACPRAQVESSTRPAPSRARPAGRSARRAARRGRCCRRGAPATGRWSARAAPRCRATRVGPPRSARLEQQLEVHQVVDVDGDLAGRAVPAADRGRRRHVAGGQRGGRATGTTAASWLRPARAAPRPKLVCSRNPRSWAVVSSWRTASGACRAAARRAQPRPAVGLVGQPEPARPEAGQPAVGAAGAPRLPGTATVGNRSGREPTVGAGQLVQCEGAAPGAAGPRPGPRGRPGAATAGPGTSGAVSAARASSTVPSRRAAVRPPGM